MILESLTVPQALKKLEEVNRRLIVLFTRKEQLTTLLLRQKLGLGSVLEEPALEEYDLEEEFELAEELKAIFPDTKRCRAQSVVRVLRIKNVNQLLEYDVRTLKKIKNIGLGEVTLKRIQELLSAHNLHLANKASERVRKLHSPLADFLGTEITKKLVKYYETPFDLVRMSSLWWLKKDRALSEKEIEKISKLLSELGFKLPGRTMWDVGAD